MKKKIEELFRLAMKAQEKTSAFVSFETSNHGWGCVVMIMDDGFEVNHGWCYGDYLEDKLIKAGIAFDSYYADSED